MATGGHQDSMASIGVRWKSVVIAQAIWASSRMTMLGTEDTGNCIWKFFGGQDSKEPLPANLILSWGNRGVKNYQSWVCHSGSDRRSQMTSKLNKT
jgi:hypothetical protein